jgi:rod shape-determining protein MreD
MIYALFLPFFLLILIVLQSIISNTLFFGVVGIEISMILVIYAGFRLDIIRGGLISFMAGFFLDCVTGSVSGLHTFTYVCLFLISMASSTRISLDKTFTIMVYTLICALFKYITITILYSSIYGIDISFNILKIFIPQILIVVLVSPVCFYIFNRLDILLCGGYARQYKRT